MKILAEQFELPLNDSRNLIPNKEQNSPTPCNTDITLTTLQQWRHIIYERGGSFISKFKPYWITEPVEISSVYFSTEYISVTYLLYRGEYFTDTITMHDWLEWAFN